MAHTEPGDDYIRRFAAFLRTHQSRLADTGFLPRTSRSAPPPQSASLLSWLSFSSSAPAAPAPPTVLSLDAHHLLYLLIRLEALGLPVGSLDTKLETPLPSNSAYLSLLRHKQADTQSIFSLQSTLSAVSSLSLPASLTSWIPGATPAPPPPIDTVLRGIYTSLTLLPALSLHPPTPHTRLVAELAADPLPIDTALPLDVFQSLAHLELDGVDPRDFLGWDRVCVGLRSLTLRRTGVEDVSDVLVLAVANDLARRAGDVRTPLRNRPGLIHRPTASLRSIPESPPQPLPDDPPPSLPSYAWSRLSTLALPSSLLTFLPPLPSPSLLALDLSSNLLVSLPPALSALSQLQALNISHNLLDSILNIPSLLPHVRTLNLSHNRLDSLCGLERLPLLERLDVRSNLIDDPAEIGTRLAQCPKLRDVRVFSPPPASSSAPASPGTGAGPGEDDPNPFVAHDPAHWRVHIFELFAREGRPEITIDGTGPGWGEQMSMSSSPAHFAPPHLPPVVVSTPPVKPVQAPPPPRTKTPTPAPSVLSVTVHPPPSPSPSQTHKRRKPARRIVDLDGGSSPDLAPTTAKPKKASAHMRSATDPRTQHAQYQPPQQEEPGSAGSSHIRSATSATTTTTRTSGEEAEAFRARIEALREEVGESWLRVLSQGRELAGVQAGIVGGGAGAGVNGGSGSGSGSGTGKGVGKVGT